MKRKSLLKVVAGLVVILVIVFGVHSVRARSRWINSTTPTIFVHGYGSSEHAETSMVNSAKRAGITNTVDNADVSASGHVTITGPKIKGKRNPIIKVNLESNKNRNMNQGARYINNVVVAFQKRDQIKRYNLVGHSMGNWDNFSFLNDYGTKAGMPKLNKQVVLAGGGTTGWGARDRDFANSVSDNMGDLKNVYPHVPVLNIMGNLDDGSHSDGRIPNKASRSVKQMLGNRPSSYRLVVFHGKHAQHSQLHENPKVFKVINNFLWGK